MLAESEKMEPKLIIHGGAGQLEGSIFSFLDYHNALLEIVGDAYAKLKVTNAREAVLHGIRLMEENPIFNAGKGARLQKDGQVRMSAAIMNSKDNSFSGVINIQNVEHPIDVANILSGQKYTVLGGHEATEFSRLNQFPYFNPITEHRLKEYKNALIGESGTVGVVALDQEGNICAGTSTGGVGYEVPGRIGDSATVAGTYATKFAGVSCTGKGEHIINQAVAARVVTRVEDGMPLVDAVDKLFEEANQFHYRFGLISLDKNGNMVVGNTKNVDVLYAKHDASGAKTFYKN